MYTQPLRANINTSCHVLLFARQLTPHGSPSLTSPSTSSLSFLCFLPFLFVYLRLPFLTFLFFSHLIPFPFRFLSLLPLSFLVFTSYLNLSFLTFPFPSLSFSPPSPVFLFFSLSSLYKLTVDCTHTS